jgi:opacity protein-like surface antigen
MKTTAAIAIGVAALMTTAAYADSNKNGDQQNNGGGKQYKLSDGTPFSNPGEMFQHLRERDGLNPAGIVEKYGSWDNVGELIHDKRVEE